jgi:hypothetical protein
LLPVVICSYKAYEKSDERAIDPAEISWSDELGNTPFFYNISRDINVKPNRMLLNEDLMKPIGWILEQLTGETDVVCVLNLPLLTDCSFAITYHDIDLFLRMQILAMFPPGMHPLLALSGLMNFHLR